MKLKEAFTAKHYREVGNLVTEELTQYVGALNKEDFSASYQDTVENAIEKWSLNSEQLPGTLEELIRLYMKESHHSLHLGCMGHQVATALPLAAMLDSIVSSNGHSNAIFELNPSGVAIEINLIKWMTKQMGFGENSAGFLTGGGTIGNITALLAARNSIEDKSKELAIITSNQAHYCVDRAVQIMGLGKEALYSIDCSASYSMGQEEVKRAHMALTTQGKSVLAVVATAGSTPTGQFDRIDEIGDYCEENNLWLHVDGAHGTSVCLSPRYKPLLKGIENASSVVWDMHKMMMMPPACAAVLFKNEKSSFNVFESNSPEYMYDKDQEDEWFNLGHRTIETTKRDYAFRFLACLRYYGIEIFQEFIDSTIELTLKLHEILDRENQIEIAVKPQINIICYRYLPRSKFNDSQLDLLQAAIRKSVIEKGNFYLTKTRLNNGIYLRNTISNPLTSKDHLKQMVACVIETGRRLEKEFQ